MPNHLPGRTADTDPLRGLLTLLSVALVVSGMAMTALVRSRRRS